MIDIVAVVAIVVLFVHIIVSFVLIGTNVDVNILI